MVSQAGSPDTAGAEVDDGAQPPVLGQQVARLRVAVKPHQATSPCGPQRGLPDPGRQRSVDVTLERAKRVLHLTVVDRQRPAAEEVVRPGRRPACGVDPVQGGEEARQVIGELRQILDCLLGDWGAVDPPVHRPWRRETASGHVRSILQDRLAVAVRAARIWLDVAHAASGSARAGG